MLMYLPSLRRALRWLVIVVGAYAVVWIALEGAILQVIALGCGVTMVAIGAVYERWIAGRTLPAGAWLALCAGFGSLAGFGSAASALVLMAVKTGLHAHGPEFTMNEIDWVLAQIPWWTTAGLLAGLGVGLILVVVRD
jgi:hypothetical protein